MTNINRLMILTATVAFFGLVAGAGPVSAQTKEVRAGSARSAKASKVAEGMVTSVSVSHMTVASDGRDLTFAITGDTDVMAKGASKAKKAAGHGTPLTMFVRAGDMVSVSYKKAAGAITASVIRVRAVKGN